MRFLREDAQTLGQPGDVLWPLGDHLGTVRDILDSAGNVVNHLRYDSFGRITSETNVAVDFLFAFTGRERDEESGLYFYRVRYYDPQVGRFVSEDPIGFVAGDTNLARYVRNSPNAWFDPTGLGGRFVLETSVPGIKLFGEYFPEHGHGELKIIKRIGSTREEEIARVTVKIVRPGNVEVIQVSTHGGRPLPGVAGSKVAKIADDLNKAVGIIMKKLGEAEARISVKIGQEIIEVGAGKISIPLWKRILGWGLGIAGGVLADVFLNPNTAYAAEPPQPIIIEGTTDDVDITEEDILKLLQVLETLEPALSENPP